MAGFPLCPKCREEYENPDDRRYHAQPTACTDCGPNLAFWNSEGRELAHRHEALLNAASKIREGAIVAVKGIGGFHLVVNARDQDAVLRLRARKHREAKPLAVMAPNLEVIRDYAEVNPMEEELLLSYAAPIVILRSKPGALPEAIAPENTNLGLMLPSSPLHALLMDELMMPIVATSGNLSDEPICIDENEALIRLKGVADYFLVHDRPIVRPIDDSVCRMLGKGPAVFRRARGYAPLPFPMTGAEPSLLATGSHMKGSVAVTGVDCVTVGQHVGDLDNALARTRLAEESHDLSTLFDSPLTAVVHDLHPDYGSTIFAQSTGLPAIGVQHHLAHACSIIAEHGVEGEVLAVVWDGTGLGPDQTIWGGEFLVLNGPSAQRVASLRPFLLPGGDMAAKEGFRAAWGALYASFGEDGFSLPALALHEQDSLVQSLLRSNTRCVETTSAGRLFDAAACLGAGIASSRFEGDAAMRWECLADREICDRYPIGLTSDEGRLLLDWAPTLRALIEDESPISTKSSRFHQSLADGIALIAKELRVTTVALTGGCFQNRLLSERVCQALRDSGMNVMEHRRIPPNDGGIAFGQAAAVIRRMTLT